MKRDDPAWNFDGSEENEATLKPLCHQVELHFVLPPKRLCRYFATWDDPALWQNGQHYRGFHVPRSCRVLPYYLISCFYHPFDSLNPDVPFNNTVAFDNLIYIRDSTCREGGVGFVMTYAHELQHFVQYGYTPGLSKVNSVLYQNLKVYEPSTIATDIPHEREANIVSRRIAERMFGADAVREYAEPQIQFMERGGDTEQRARWVFFRDVPSATVYNLLQETIPLVEKYRSILNFGVDTTQPEWWSTGERR
jgi:hypothetical protein